MSALSSLWHCITGSLFPTLEEDLDPLTDKQREFVAVCELAQLDRHMGRYRWTGKGRKKKARVDLAKAFVAKAVYNLPTMVVLVAYVKDCKVRMFGVLSICAVQLLTITGMRQYSAR